MRILLVEDDIALSEALLRSLRSEGFAVDHVNKGGLAISAILSGEIDMVILDLGLPDIDGLDVLCSIRGRKLTLPILILTARDAVSDKIQGLDSGADDYLAKPFEMNELFARLRVIERRLGTAQSSVIQHGAVSIDTASHSVCVKRYEVELPRKEYMLLKALMDNVGRIQSKHQLESKLYEWGDEVASNAIEVHVSNLRKKLPNNFIKTIRGVGYSVNTQVSQ